MLKQNEKHIRGSSKSWSPPRWPLCVCTQQDPVGRQNPGFNFSLCSLFFLQRPVLLITRWFFFHTGQTCQLVKWARLSWGQTAPTLKDALLNVKCIKPPSPPPQRNIRKGRGHVSCLEEGFFINFIIIIFWPCLAVCWTCQWPPVRTCNIQPRCNFERNPVVF